MKRRFVFIVKGKEYKLTVDVPSEELAQDAELKVNVAIEGLHAKAKTPEQLWMGVAIQLALQLAALEREHENLVKEIEKLGDE